jgi:hypothetical protein
LDKGYVAICPIQHQQAYFLALKQFAKDVGAPNVLVCDPHPTQKQRKVKEFCTQIGRTFKVLEAQTSGITGLITLALLRRLQEKICGPLVCP